MRSISNLIIVCFFGGAIAAYSTDLYSEYRSIGKSGDVIEVTKTINFIETQWSKNISSYSIHCDALIAGLRLATESDPAKMEVLEQLVSSLLEKEKMVRSAELSREDSRALLGVQVRGIQALLSSASVLSSSGEDRLRYAQMAASFINEVSKQVILDFKRIPTYSNIVPPIRSGPGAPGMSPQGIKDPTARAAYVKAIEENRRKSALNARQAELRTALQNIEFQLIPFIEDTLKTHPGLSGQCLKVLEGVNLEDVGITPFRRIGQKK